MTSVGKFDCLISLRIYTCMLFNFRFEIRERMNWKGSDTMYDAWLLKKDAPRQCFDHAKFYEMYRERLISNDEDPSFSEVLSSSFKASDIILSSKGTQHRSLLKRNVVGGSSNESPNEDPNSLPINQSNFGESSRESPKDENSLSINASELGESSNNTPDEEIKWWQLMKFVPKKVVKEVINLVSDDEGVILSEDED